MVEYDILKIEKKSRSRKLIKQVKKLNERNSKYIMSIYEN